MTAFRNLDSVRDAVTAAAAAAAAALHTAVPVTLDAASSGDVSQDLLTTGDRAVSLHLRGAATGTLVVVVSAALAAALEEGPLGHQELVAALGPALADAGTALEQYCAAPLQLEAAYEVEAGVALAGLADDRLSATVTLRAEGQHVATLALLVDPPAPAAIPQPRGTVGAAAHDFQPLNGTSSTQRASRPLDLLHDVEMGLTAELGRTRMTVRDLLSLTPGAVVELDRAAGSPVDVLVNGTLIARGEVVVVDEEFAIRISEIVRTGLDAPARR